VKVTRKSTSSVVLSKAIESQGLQPEIRKWVSLKHLSVENIKQEQAVRNY